jgi:hypothetical protein
MLKHLDAALARIWTLQSGSTAAISRTFETSNANNRHLGLDGVFNRYDETPTADIRARDPGHSAPRI